jgi:hypothetical protein
MSPDESTSRRFCSKLILTKLAKRCPAAISAMRHMRIQSHVHSQPEPRSQAGSATFTVSQSHVACCFRVPLIANLIAAVWD